MADDETARSGSRRPAGRSLGAGSDARRLRWDSRAKSNRWLRLGWRWFHELPDGIKYNFELVVVFFLKAIELAGKVVIGEKHFAQADERAHDGNVYLYGAG